MSEIKEPTNVIESSFISAFQTALRQWKSYYDNEGCLRLDHGDDDEPSDDDLDLSTARHPEGDAYRWCERQLKRMQEKQLELEGADLITSPLAEPRT